MERHLHSSQPRPLARTKFRDPAQSLANASVSTAIDATVENMPSNIMFDKRVKRGVPGAQRPVLASSQTFNPSSSTNPLNSTSSTPGSAGGNSSTQKPRRSLSDLQKPAPDSLLHILKHTHVVKPRVEVPIHLYLEEQSAPKPVSEIDTQTDDFLEQAPHQPYVPPKRGVDVRIQVR